MRLTKTVQKHLDKRLFKNSRCKLYGWQLHPVDQERLRNHTEQEMVLQHMPEKLFVEMPEATWTEYEQLGPGVIAIEPDVVTWALDKHWKVLVKRRGFCIAPDLSGTAHSFVGATLQAASRQLIYSSMLFRK